MKSVPRSTGLGIRAGVVELGTIAAPQNRTTKPRPPSFKAKCRDDRSLAAGLPGYRIGVGLVASSERITWTSSASGTNRSRE